VPSVKSLPKGGDPAPAPAAAADDVNPVFAGGRYEIALLEATVRVPNNDFRAALEYVERLAADIGRLEGFRAEVSDSPLDMRSTMLLQGRLAEKDAAMMEPRFTLRIVRERSGAA
jgi:hypothetical protein